MEHICVQDEGRTMNAHRSLHRSFLGARWFSLFLTFVAFMTCAISVDANGIDDAKAGLTAFKRQDFDEAIRLYSQAIASGQLTDESRAEAHARRGSAYTGKGQTNSSLADYNAAIRLQPNYAPAYVGRGTAYFLSDQLDRALADFDQALRLKPDLAMAYHNRGLIYQQKRQYDKAIADFDEALRLDPNLIGAYQNRANVLREKGQYKQAIVDQNEMVREMPHDAGAYYNRGLIRFPLGQFSEAAEDFARSLTLAGTNTMYTPLTPSWTIWLHIARGRAGQSDVDELNNNANKLDLSKWPGPVISLYLGRSTIQEVQHAARRGNAQSRCEQCCEADFYIGEHELIKKNIAAARSWLQHSVETCPAGHVARIAADAELKRLAH